MKDEIKTTLLEYDKSTFLIDLVKHNNDAMYVAITQTIKKEGNKTEVQQIKINPTVLLDIIEVLTDYKDVFPTIKRAKKDYISPEKVSEMIKRYLKGKVELKDLAMQFDCKEEIIEQIFNNKGIKIVSNEIPTEENKWKRKHL